MFSHIMIGANDVAASKKFYDAVLGALGHKPGTEDDRGRVFYFTPTGVFAITKPIDGAAATGGNGSTIGFAADSPGAGEGVARRGPRERGHRLRGSAGRTTRLGHGPRVPARPLRQQDLRPASPEEVSAGILP